ncbi:MAG: type III pantothenate kinase [Bacteroidia bacterium]|nr:type III pantothenate kinase [Bacteroidia bacterium]
MLLVTDIGNSDIVFGVWEEGHWLYQWRHASSRYLSTGAALQKYAEEAGINLRDFSQVIMSSVVPGVSPAVKTALGKLTGSPVTVIGPEIFRRMDMRIDNPDEIGSDLVANAVAAYSRFSQAAIVVDFGTALTFTTVSDRGEILGVAIAPGLKTAMQALFFNTAQLPVVPLELPTSAIGKNTAHALQAGILMGYVGLVNELLDRIQAELPTKAKVLATGGLSSVLAPLKSRFDEVDPMLTLDGLRLIAEKYF